MLHSILFRLKNKTILTYCECVFLLDYCKDIFRKRQYKPTISDIQTKGRSLRRQVDSGLSQMAQLGSVQNRTNLGLFKSQNILKMILDLKKSQICHILDISNPMWVNSVIPRGFPQSDFQCATFFPANKFLFSYLSAKPRISPVII